MALVLNTSPGSDQANSYVGLEEMREYVETRVADESVAEAWVDLEPAARVRLLVNATRAIDMATHWLGQKYYHRQALAWPRYQVYVEGFMLETTTIPQRVKEAVMEMAIWSMGNGEATSVGQNAEFDSIKVGPIAIDFNESAGGTSKTYYPDVVAYLLRGLGEVSNPELPSNNRMKVARLVRA